MVLVRLAVETSTPWKEHLFNLEEELCIPWAEKPLYVLYGEGTGKNWRIQAVPATQNNFLSKKSLPEPWRGMKDEQLSDTTGVPGAVFVHTSGFIGGRRGLEDG